MSYVKTNWINGQTRINATNLNHIEEGIETVENKIPSNSNIVDLIYPVGAIYMSVNSTSPGTLFGGIWEQIKDKFMLSAGDTYAAASTGGASSVSYTPSGTVGNTTLTTSQIPKHTHTYSKSATATGASSGNTGSTTLTAAQSGIPSHIHKGIRWYNSNDNTITLNSGNQVGLRLPYTNGDTDGDKIGIIAKESTAASASSGHTHSLNAHTHSITLTSTNSGESGTGGAHNHGFTGTKATINTIPPYLAVYVWKRVS